MATESERFVEWIEKLPIAIVVVDASGRVNVVNSAARQLFYEAEMSINNPGVDFSRLAEPDGTPILRENFPLWRSIKLRESVQGRVLRVRRLSTGKADSDLFVQVDSRPLQDPTGELAGVIAVFQDVTARVQLEEKNRADANRSRQLASLTRAFSETKNSYPTILTTIARLVAEATADACIIRLLNDEGNLLKLAGWHHLEPEKSAIFSLILHETQLSTGLEGFNQVLTDLKPIVLNQITEGTPLVQELPEALRQMLLDCSIHSMVIAPLYTAGRKLGTLSVLRSSRMPPFTVEDQAFFQELADRAAQAIEYARLYAEEVQRNRELNALHDATTALMSTLDLEELLGRILDAAQRAIPAADRGLLFLAAPRTGRLEVRAMLGFNDPRIRRTGFLRDGNLERAIREKRPLLIDDTAYQDEWTGQADEEMSALRSAIFAPLVLKGDVLGALTLSSFKACAFSQADLRLLVSFAATTTAALHNAMLHAEVQKTAITDSLTGLYNRRGLEELGRHEIDRFVRFGHPLSIIMIDIDHFKRVNDQYGHAVGDQVLSSLAERCRAIIRQVDIFGRYGGEEFVVLLPETDLFQTMNIAERLRSAVADELFVTDQGEIPVTISLGVSRANRSLSTLSTLFEQADVALYDAKVKGRNRVEIG